MAANMISGYTNATAAKASAPDAFRNLASIKPGVENSNAPITPGTARRNMVGSATVIHSGSSEICSVAQCRQLLTTKTGKTTTFYSIQ